MGHTCEQTHITGTHECAGTHKHTHVKTALLEERLKITPKETAEALQPARCAKEYETLLKEM